MITFKNVTKYYNNFKALDNLSFEIKQGEIFGIIGQSGAGKSTLVRTINQIEKISSGGIIVDDVVVSECSKKSLNDIRNEIGFVFQNFNLLQNLNVFDNIALPLQNQKQSKEQINKRIADLLELVGLSDFKNSYIHQLSGGQQQRVGIARALALNPKVLLCDEATSALDPQTTNQILDLLLEINDKLNITIVVITHEMEVIKTICDDVVVLDKGVIVDSGRVLDVFSNPSSNVTKDLLEAVFSEDLHHVKEEVHPSKYVVVFNYKGDALDNHGLYNLTKQLDIDFNIIGGQILATRQGKYGRLYVEFSKKKAEVEQYLKEEGFTYEVIV